MQEIVVIWITFLRSTYPDKILSYKATEIYMELKGRAVWRKGLKRWPCLSDCLVGGSGTTEAMKAKKVWFFGISKMCASNPLSRRGKKHSFRPL